ncbi:MAG: twin-arginine translocase TatA/TatE family subunit [Rectinemataceae bacterium]|nr:twin-arginine translocase TatA/TatE family subunit [Rectinemataceae bacterium]
MIGFKELLIILVVVLVVFGVGKLPKVMGDVGKGIKNLKEGLKGEEAPESKSETHQSASQPPANSGSTPPAAS